MSRSLSIPSSPVQAVSGTEGSTLDLAIRPLAKRLSAQHMAALGIANTMRLAHAYNRAKFRAKDNRRRSLFQEQLPALSEENGAPERPPVEMPDGWAIDISMSLPHLDRLLEIGDAIVAERAGDRRKVESYRSWFQNLWSPADSEKYPGLLDFATSSSLLATVANYLGCIPVLSTTLPSGVRIVESSIAFDDSPGVLKDSQLYHIDYYARPNVYVIVLLQDTTLEHGPFTFLPRGISQKAAADLNYWGWKRPYRLSDEEIYFVVDRREAIEFCYPRGTVLFIEPSGCFHYGSRNCVKPRFLAMFAYTGVCRTDFSEILMEPERYPARDTDSRLRKLVLDRDDPSP